MLLQLYTALSWLALPLAPILLRKRVHLGKELPDRIEERYGKATVVRPKGRIIWVHAASIGESFAVLPLITLLLKRYPDLQLVMTSGTVTSARLLAKRLPDRAIHQFIPLDNPLYIGRFLTYWRPDIVLWLESELWPNWLRAIQRKGIPLYLINARMSPASYARWQRYRASAHKLLGYFTAIFPQSELDATRYRNLGADAIMAIGNLKYDAPALAADPDKTGQLITMIAGRPVWLAASTHPGEEALVVQAHYMIAERESDLLTIIVPRHADRGNELAAELRAQGLHVAQRSKGEPITDDTQLYLADTMGELGMFYRLVSVVLIGGTLVPHGGQNPLEPARLDCAIIAGPHTDNFTDICQSLNDAGGLQRIDDIASLAEQVFELHIDSDLQDRLASAAHNWVDAQATISGTIADHLRGPLESRLGLTPIAEPTTEPVETH